MPQPGSHEGQDARVLVVENLAVVREAVAMRLDREPGFTVRQAGSVAEALKMLEGVDIAVLDLRLPDGNGADLIERIQAVNPDAKALVHTSSIDPADIDQALDRGAAAVLDKRAGLDELVATLKGLQGPSGY